MKRTGYVTLGIAFSTAIVAVLYLVGLIFRQDFVSTQSLTIQSTRAGLLMDVGGEVKLRGVQIGRVASIQSDGTGAKIKLAIDSDRMKLIPANVRAQIIPPTVFGAKYVDLIPSEDQYGTIATNGVVTADHVTVEVNSAFEHLIRLLKAAQPAKVNATLNALAGALNGNGTRIGNSIEQLKSYLGSINPVLPVLADDISRSKGVLRSYDRLAPGLLDIVRNTTVTSETLVDQQRGLTNLLSSFGTAAGNVRTLLSENAKPLYTTLTTLDPVSRILDYYSPELACTIEGLDEVNKLSLRSFGNTVPGILSTTSILPGQEPYKYPADLPVVRANDGPNCNGLPLVSVGSIHDRPAVQDVGTNPYATTSLKPAPVANLSGTLLGLAGAAGGL